MFVYVTSDDLHAALADIDEGREVDWVAMDGTPVTLRVVKSDNQEGVNG
jgi:hypothetical protein